MAKIYIVYDPSGWDQEQLRNASAYYVAGSKEDAEQWMKENDKLDCPIYSYTSMGKNLSGEKLENPRQIDKVPDKPSPKEKSPKVIIPKTLKKTGWGLFFFILGEIIIGSIWLTLKIFNMFLGKKN